MKSTAIGNVVLDGKKTRIIVPLTSCRMEDLEAEARELFFLPADMAEWRIDLAAPELRVLPGMQACLDMLHAALRVPLLATLRTVREGGHAAVAPGAYEVCCAALCHSGMIDALDVEAYSMGDQTARRIVRYAHANAIPVIASSHDFFSTPPKEEIVRRLRHMQDFLEADVLKIAVMPQCPADVLALLSAAEEMHSRYAERPVIAMSMGRLGVPSRVCGQFFGSAAVFASGRRASAPGQLEASKMRIVLDAMEDAAAKNP